LVNTIELSLKVQLIYGKMWEDFVEIERNEKWQCHLCGCTRLSRILENEERGDIYKTIRDLRERGRREEKGERKKKWQYIKISWHGLPS